MTVPLEERKRRVAAGSRRKRDLAAVGQRRPEERWQRQADAEERRVDAREQRRAEREARLRPRIAPSPGAEAVWAKARECLRAALLPSAFDLWIEATRCIGEIDRAVVVEVERPWTERRYGRLIGDAVRAVSDWRGVYIVRAPRRESDDEGDGLL